MDIVSRAPIINRLRVIGDWPAQLTAGIGLRVLLVDLASYWLTLRRL
jgi:hypothetical protein